MKHLINTSLAVITALAVSLTIMPITAHGQSKTRSVHQRLKDLNCYEWDGYAVTIKMTDLCLEIACEADKIYCDE